MLHLEEKTNPTLEYMIDMVANNTGQTNYRDQLEENLAKSHMHYGEKMTPIVFHRWRAEDCTTTERIELLEPLHCINSELQIIDLLYAGGDQTTMRGILEDEMQNKESAHQQAFAEMIRAKCQSEEYTIEQRLADLDLIDSPYMEYTLADFEASNGQLQEALYRLDEMILNRDLSKEQLKAHTEMITWLNLRSEISDWATINSTQMNTLETLAYSSAQSLASINAQSILNEYFEGQFYSEANTSFTEMGTRSAHLQTEIVNPIIQVYPIPADEFINVQLYLQKWNETTAMQVLNSNGQLIEELKIINAEQQLILPTNDLASGVYHIKIIQDGKQIEELAFTVAR